MLSVIASTMVYASPSVKPYQGGPTQAEIDAKLLKEKEMLPPYPGKSAQELWQEGESLFANKQYGEGVVMMRAGLALSRDSQQQDRLAQYEADLIQQKKKALELRQKGKDWQMRGNAARAAAAYQSSLQLWPDMLLEQHIKQLNSPSPVKSGVEMVEMVPCDILDVSAVAVPGDFSLEYAPGTDKSDRKTVTRDEIFADGRLVRYSRSRLSYHQAGPPTYMTAATRIPEMAVRRLYAATQACSFHELKSHSSKSGGTAWVITLKTAGKQHSVGVLRTFVSRFEYLRDLFNKTIQGSL